MKLIFRTYRYALLPNKEQEILLNKDFGCVRWIYNYFLSDRIEQYKATKKSDNYYKQASCLKLLKRKEETLWLKEVNSQTLQFALKCLNTAFVNFFERKAKYPRFKSKKGPKNNFTVSQFVKVEGDRLFFPKCKEGIRINLHRPMERQGEKVEIRRCTVSKKATGKYFVSILCQVEHEPKAGSGKCCGIDLGIKDFAVTSDGMKFENCHHLKRYERQLATAQKHLSRKIKGSNKRNQSSRVLAIFSCIDATFNRCWFLLFEPFIFLLRCF